MYIVYSVYMESPFESVKAAVVHIAIYTCTVVRIYTLVIQYENLHTRPYYTPAFVISNILESSVVSNLGDILTLEVYRIQLLFSRKLLGLATIPLHSIRHSNKVQTVL